jgi:hypothetical protein
MTGHGSRAAAHRIAAWTVLGASLAFALVPRPAAARPIDSLCPGGCDAPRDTVVIELPVARAPSLLALRASGPLAADPANGAASDTTASVLRNETRSWTASATTAGAADAGGTIGTDNPGDAITFSGLKLVRCRGGANRAASMTHRSISRSAAGSPATSTSPRT